MREEVQDVLIVICLLAVVVLGAAGGLFIYLAIS